MQHLPPANLGEKAKIFVCGPPGQVAAISGPKAGYQQGELGGILKKLGYTEEQVRPLTVRSGSRTDPLVFAQVFKF